MTSHAGHSAATLDIEQTRWQIDPSRSSVEFHVSGFYGLQTVKGHFERYDGTLALSARPAVALTIDANSLTTNHKRRDKHLRSADFFDVDNHPQVRFTSDTAELDGEQLTVRGHLHAAGRSVPLQVEVVLRPVDDELEVEAAAHADQRVLGMTYSPLGMIRPRSKLIVHGRLVKDD